MSQNQTRQLGDSGIAVPLLTFGGNVFGWTVDQTTSFSLLDALVDRGLWFIDTADVYSRWAPGNKGGESETIMGEWLKKRQTRPDRAGNQGRHGIVAGENRAETAIYPSGS